MLDGEKLREQEHISIIRIKELCEEADHHEYNWFAFKEQLKELVDKEDKMLKLFRQKI